QPVIKMTGHELQPWHHEGPIPSPHTSLPLLKDRNVNHVELDNGHFDESFDVVIAGYGFGGGFAAIEAARHGATVLICEKMPQPGGVSICSGGGVRCATNAEDAFSYLKATNAGTTPDDVLRVLADGMAKAETYVKELVAPIDGVSVNS